MHYEIVVLDFKIVVFDFKIFIKCSSLRDRGYKSCSALTNIYIEKFDLTSVNNNICNIIV